MSHEVSRNPRHARSVEIRGLTYNKRSALCDLAALSMRIPAVAHSQPNVDAEFDQVNVPVINNEIDVDRGMLRQQRPANRV